MTVNVNLLIISLNNTFLNTSCDYFNKYSLKAIILTSKRNLFVQFNHSTINLYFETETQENAYSQFFNVFS